MLAACTAVAVAIVAWGLTRPSTVGLLLVVSAALAGLGCWYAAAQGEGVDRHAWSLIGLGQALNAVGNLAIMLDADAWFDQPDWASTLVFSAATLSTVVGLLAFVVPGTTARLVELTVDVLIVVGCAFVIAWTFRIDALRIDGADGLVSADDLGNLGGFAFIASFGVLGLMMDVVGVAVAGFVTQSRPRGERGAILLAGVAMLIATLGDAGITAASLRPELASMTWVASSVTFLVASALVPRVPTLTWELPRRRSIDLATILAGATVVVLLLHGRQVDTITKVVSGLTILLVLARQLMMSRANAVLAGELERSERHFRTMVDGTRDVFLMVGDDGRVAYASPAATDLFGLTPDLLVGLDATTLLQARDKARITNIFGQMTIGTWDRIEAEIRRPDGTRRQLDAQCSRTVDGFILSVRDISETVEMLRRVEIAASHDMLTRLPNRLSFETALRQRLADNGSASVVFMDLDGFKRVNDTSGHAAGDALLVQVAHRLKASVADCLVARFGGDEFAILLRAGVSTDGASVLAAHAQQAVAGVYHVAGNEITIGATAGLAYADSGTVEEVMRNADLALYEAKAVGHGALRVFDQSMYDREVRRVELDERLRRALSSQDLSVYYQPVLDLQTGTITSAEALVRWFDGDSAVLAPDELISLAESTGSVTALGEWVMSEAIKQAADWQRTGHCLSIAVNISTKQLLDGRLAETVDRLLRSEGLDPRLLVLEITESVLLEDADRAIATMDLLKELGVRIAIDDFGTGYSSLTYLSRLPVDQLKVDRYFVSGLGMVESRTAIVQTIVRLCRDLGLTVTAEGVEQPHQLDILREMGVNQLQGFLISKPLAAPEIATFLDHGGPVLDRIEAETLDRDIAQLLGGPDLLPARLPSRHLDRARGIQVRDLIDLGAVQHRARD
jgi:diguanylate cyclase (GGDEF)-like protein/PAS domain S-box-containing protein